MGQEAEDGGRWPFSGACGAIGAMGSNHVPKNVDVSFHASSFHASSFHASSFHASSFHAP